MKHTHPQRTIAAIPRVLVVLVLSAAIVGSAAIGSDRHATADAITDKIGQAQQQLAADGATMDQLRAELAAAATQEEALAKAINDLDAQIATAEAQVNDAQNQLNAIETALSIAQDNLAVTREKLASDRQQLRAEMVVMYKAQVASNSFSNFLNSGDFNSFWQHVLDVNRLNSSEQRMVARVSNDEQTIQADVDQVATKKDQQTQLLAALHGIVDQLNSALAERQKAQQQLRDLQARDQQLLAENEAAVATLHAQIAQLQVEEAAALAAGGGSGRFGWPLTGDITQGFGCTPFTFEPYDPNCPSRHFHSGIDISSGCGDQIVAADSGIVNLHDTVPYGFGLYVTIAHGNGWASTYGHMSGFAVGDGQAVSRGQLIGWEGTTGNSTGCHLHFEIDHYNNPQNPLAYLS